MTCPLAMRWTVAAGTAAMGRAINVTCVKSCNQSDRRRRTTNFTFQSIKESFIKLGPNHNKIIIAWAHNYSRFPIQHFLLKYHSLWSICFWNCSYAGSECIKSGIWRSNHERTQGGAFPQYGTLRHLSIWGENDQNDLGFLCNKLEDWNFLKPVCKARAHCGPSHVHMLCMLAAHCALLAAAAILRSRKNCNQDIILVDLQVEWQLKGSISLSYYPTFCYNGDRASALRRGRLQNRPNFQKLSLQLSEKGT